MAESYTKGPWGVDYGHVQQNGTVYWQVHDGSDAICCNQFCYALNSDANARLIAAAPDLVEALQAIELARTTDLPEDWERATKLSDAALSRALGQEG